VRYADVPNRGTLATISTPDKSFECHVDLDKARGAAGVAGRAAPPEQLLHCTEEQPRCPLPPLAARAAAPRLLA
jgi:hypothetical protein